MDSGLALAVNPAAGHGCYRGFVMRAAMTTTPESVPAR
jgi:hypothetical protein